MIFGNLPSDISKNHPEFMKMSLECLAQRECFAIHSECKGQLHTVIHND